VTRSAETSDDQRQVIADLQQGLGECRAERDEVRQMLISGLHPEYPGATGP